MKRFKVSAAIVTSIAVASSLGYFVYASNSVPEEATQNATSSQAESQPEPEVQTDPQSVSPAETSDGSTSPGIYPVNDSANPPQPASPVETPVAPQPEAPVQPTQDQVQAQQIQNYNNAYISPPSSRPTGVMSNPSPVVEAQ